MMKSSSMALPTITKWTGCYDGGWLKIISSASFKHPAKFAKGLIERIYDHCFACGYLNKNDVVGDPFGGVGTGGIIAAYRGLRWIGCELEPAFVGFAQENFSRHKKKWEYMGLPFPKIIQGDSRKFDEHVAGIVSSPPYAKISPEAHGPGIDVEKNYETYRKSGGGCSLEKFKASREKHSQGYPSSEGQIGDLKPGSVEAVVSSPPYSDTLRGNQHEGIDWEKAKRNSAGGGEHQAKGKSVSEDYGKSDGQIGALKSGNVDVVISSPPYAGTSGSGGGGINVQGYKPAPGRKWTSPCGNPDDVGKRSYQGQGGDRASGNIETLKEGSVDSVISSPPYSDIAAGAGGLNTKPAKKPGQQSGRKAESASQDTDQKYGKTEGQISQLKGGSVDGVIKASNVHSLGVSRVLCNAPTVSPQSEEDQSGASSVTNITLDGQGCQKLLITEEKSASLTTECPSRFKPDQTINSGEEETIGGAGLDGTFAGEKQKNETGTNVSAVEEPQISQSTTSKNPKKQITSGTTLSKTLKLCADHATEKSMAKGDECSYSNASADIAGANSKRSDHLLKCAIKPTVGDGKTPKNITGGLLRSAENGNAVFAKDCSSLLENDQNTVRMPVRTEQERSTCGNLTQDEEQTYWSEVFKIYTACFRCIRPGGVIVLVVKDYCAKGKRVRLCDDTLRLLEHIGFAPLERIHAMLVTETVEAGLFGEERTKRQRKSFFRRLHEDLIQAQLHWVDVKIKPSYLWTAKAVVWNAYRDRLNHPTEKEKADPKLWPPPKPTAKKVLREAQFAAWRAAGKPVRPDERRIDFEEVLIARRP